MNAPQVVKILPGTVRIDSSPMQMASVVSYGIAISLYDNRQQFGGMCHYIYPVLPDNMPATAKFAKPSLLTMLKLFQNAGSDFIDLEANVYGASENPLNDDDLNKIAKANLKVALHMLATYNLKISGMDVCGNKGRKIMFNPNNGEVVVAKVSSLRNADWQI